MANTRISELTQLTSGELNRSDLLLIVDVVGTPKTKNVQLGDLADYVTISAGSVPVESFNELSASVVSVSSSVVAINAITSSLLENSSVGKLDSSLTGSYTAYGLPVLDSEGYIYANFLHGEMSSFNNRSGIVTSQYGDYSGSMIRFISSSTIPHTNVQSAIDSIDTNKVSKNGYDTITGRLYTSNNPTSSYEVSNKQYTDTKLSLSGGTLTGALILSGSPSAQNEASNKGYADTKLSLSGGIITGRLYTTYQPTSSFEVANKSYVDTQVSQSTPNLSAYLPISGGVMAGRLELYADPIQQYDAATMKYTDTKLSLSGGTLLGNLYLAGLPPSSNAAANKGYVDTFVSQSGGTISGRLYVSNSPTSSLEVANKGYVDLFVPLSGGTMTGPLTSSAVNINSNLLYISSGSNSIGIGTNSPTQSSKLDINGMVRATSIQFTDNSTQTSATSFNGRTGSIYPSYTDYNSYYISTNGYSSIYNGGLTFSNDISNITEQTLMFGLLIDDNTSTTVEVHQSATSSLNGLIQDGDFAIISKTQISGSDEYDVNSPSIVIGNYTSGSNGIRVSNHGVQIPNGLTQGVLILSSSAVLNSIQYYVCDSTSSITVTLPTASLSAGKLYTVKNKNTGSVIIDATSTGLLDGMPTSSLNQWSSITIISDGSTWNNI